MREFVVHVSNRGLGVLQAMQGGPLVTAAIPYAACKRYKTASVVYAIRLQLLAMLQDCKFWLFRVHKWDQMLRHRNVQHHR